MRTITDSQGRAYDLDLNVQSYRRVLADTGIDLGLIKGPGPKGQPLLVEIRESITTLFDVLWAIVRPKAQKSKVNFDDFQTAFFGPEYIAARDAFLEEWALYCRTLGRVSDAEIVEKFQEARESETSSALKTLNEGIGGFSTTSLSSPPESSASPIQAD